MQRRRRELAVTAHRLGPRPRFGGFPTGLGWKNGPQEDLRKPVGVNRKAAVRKRNGVRGFSRDEPHIGGGMGR